jgi:CRISPR-associated protein Cas8a1/Csx13
MRDTKISLDWPSGTPDRKALALLLEASFRRTEDGMIDLPGLGLEKNREEVLLAVHSGLAQTFLQHPKKRPGKGVGTVALKVGDEDVAAVFTFKRVDRYSHQVAQGTGLLGEGWDVSPGEPPDVVPLSQALLPGAMVGASDLQASPRDAFLLQYLIVACPVFLVRSRRREEKVQSSIVVPDVTDLKLFSMRVRRTSSRDFPRFSNTYLGRVVGGAEEAALRFLMDLRAGEAAEALGVSSFLVVAMGKVPWDKNQQNRSGIAHVAVHYDEMAVFEAAAAHLSKSRVVQTKKGDPFVIPDCPMPELVAANLAAGEHWCAHFQDLIAEKKDFASLLYRKEGLRAMRDAIQDKEDRLVIERFQKAWEMTMGAIGERAKKEGADFSRLVEVERERIRNDLLRTRTSEQTASWLLNFMARASREGTPKVFARDIESFRKFLFNPRNVDRLKNLLLFALVSYTSVKPPDDGGDDPASDSPIHNSK